MIFRPRFLLQANDVGIGDRPRFLLQANDVNGEENVVCPQFLPGDGDEMTMMGIAALDPSYGWLLRC